MSAVSVMVMTCLSGRSWSCSGDWWLWHFFHSDLCF